MNPPAPSHPGECQQCGTCCRRGGPALFVDMVTHDRDSYRHSMGHQHLGFGEAHVKQWAGAAGLTDVRYRRLRPDMSAKGPGLFVATMRKA